MQADIFRRALATSVLLSLLAAVALSSFVIPSASKLEPASLRINNFNVVLGRAPGERTEKEFAFARFDIMAGACPKVFREGNAKLSLRR